MGNHFSSVVCVFKKIIIMQQGVSYLKFMLLILKLQSLFVLSVMENYFPNVYVIVTTSIYFSLLFQRARNTVLLLRDVLRTGKI